MLPPQPCTSPAICCLPALQKSKVQSCNHLFLATDQFFPGQCAVEIIWMAFKLKINRKPVCNQAPGEMRKKYKYSLTWGKRESSVQPPDAITSLSSR